ncbi:1770_t:CDS:2 [Paraglomus brasilianum]|uniref:1770_t:CDS:1 n=1 Tax=Paraglomus brasilianum TaxID=144538 RepID=A0A9N8WEE6_9GLOM|nr:1770_t:CDS:2 [Paraglomus brasilianum]
MSTDFLPYSVLSGTFAALASVSAKLFSDARTFSFTIYVCEVVYGSGCEDLIYPIRALCFGLMFLFNAAMWTFYTKALNKSSSIKVTVVNSATNFCMTAILGHLLFNEALYLQWWFGATLIITGTVIISRKNKEKVE